MPLAQAQRYGDVRGPDVSAVAHGVRRRGRAGAGRRRTLHVHIARRRRGSGDGRAAEWAAGALAMLDHPARQRDWRMRSTSSPTDGRHGLVHGGRHGCSTTPARGPPTECRTSQGGRSHRARRRPPAPRSSRGSLRAAAPCSFTTPSARHRRHVDLDDDERGVRRPWPCCAARLGRSNRPSAASSACSSRRPTRHHDAFRPRRRWSRAAAGVATVRLMLGLEWRDCVRGSTSCRVSDTERAALAPRSRWRRRRRHGRPLGGDDSRIDAALGALYDAADDGRRPWRAARRVGGLGRSAPAVSRWLGDIRRYFPSPVVQVLQRDAVERLDLTHLLLEPELLADLEPDVHLVSVARRAQPAAARGQGHGPPGDRRRARPPSRQRFADRTRTAVNGALARASRSHRPRPGRHRLDTHDPRQPAPLAP